MENYFNPVLSEEQMAAYLDGMLSTEESRMVEELISSNPEMAEIQEAVDSIDSTYIYESGNEIPIECLADDFSLPSIGTEFDQIENVYGEDDYLTDEPCITDEQENANDLYFQDETSDIGQDEQFSESGYEGFDF